MDIFVTMRELLACHIICP